MDEAPCARIVGVRPAGDPLTFWREAGETLGQSAQLLEDSVTGEEVPAAGGWMDVRYEPDRLDTYRHANVGQPLHTDGAYGSILQDIGVFYLERQAQAGGESLFVEADAVANYAAEIDPMLLARLFDTPVRFGKGKTIGRLTPILREHAGKLRLNWNYFRVLPDQGEGVARLREDFRLFLEDMVEHGPVAAFRLDAGDAMIFRDDQVLHGRKGYAAKASGDRLLWKTYFISPAQAVANASCPSRAA
jgi:alpha-ketoglutarate-dependent taurine dioxygenase